MKEEDLQKKAFTKIYIFFSITIAICIIYFIMNNVYFFLIAKKVQKFEENKPDIELSGIQSFSFNYEVQGNNPEYKPEISILGYAGKPIYDCYNGVCSYKVEENCGDEDNEYYNTCIRIENYTIYNASKDCRNTNGTSCSCKKYNYNNVNGRCSCSIEEDQEEYSSSKSCSADNIILNWRNYYYNKVETKAYPSCTYLNCSVPKSEDCPEGMHLCGILDELGNKLCYPEKTKCPINYITLDKTDKKYNYSSITIDDITLYYTNEAIDDGRVLGGFFVDSDLMINYNIGDCQIISNDTISKLLDSQPNKLYRNSLSFDPYSDKNIDEKGKSYLKWCIPRYGKEKNITLIRQLIQIYEFNKTINYLFLNGFKDEISSFWIIFSFHIFFLIALTSILFSILKCEKSKYKCIFILFIILILLLFLFFFIAAFSIYLGMIIKVSRLESFNMRKEILISNIILFCLNFLLFIFTIIFIIFIYLARYSAKINSHEIESLNTPLTP